MPSRASGPNGLQDNSKEGLLFMPVALATLQSRPPSGPSWIHEEKLDGYRIEAVRTEDGVQLLSRNSKDWTSRFPVIAEGVMALPATSAVLDGEVVAVDKRGISSFQKLQKLLEYAEIRDVRYHVFDVLWLNGSDLRELPLALRRELLVELLSYRDARSAVHPTREIELRNGIADPLEQACALGYEGVISKRSDVGYPRGRSPLWIKSKCSKRQEFVIVGYTDPQGSRSHFGALLVAVYDGGRLRYSGKVGTGFDEAALKSLWHDMKPRELSSTPEIESPASFPRNGIHWIDPTLVAEVAFTEWTSDGLLRHPVFKGLRADKSAAEVRRED